MIHKLIKSFAPVAALVGAAMVVGCDNVNLNVGEGEGVPLAELDTSGAAPTQLVLAGPDRVIVTHGDELDIQVSGDERAVEALRFSLEDHSLAINRAEGNWKDTGKATVRLTVPALTEVITAGSGSIELSTMARKAKVTIAGSGKVAVAAVDAEKLEVSVLGSGGLTATGRAEKLDLTVAGSGGSDMSGLVVDRAVVNVLGSGNASFASDGKVKATIAGSGTVTVIGRADCTVEAIGSGKLRCRTAPDASDAAAAPDAPAAPNPPTPPPAPEAPAAPEAPEA